MKHDGAAALKRNARGNQQRFRLSRRVWEKVFVDMTQQRPDWPGYGNDVSIALRTSWMCPEQPLSSNVVNLTCHCAGATDNTGLFIRSSREYALQMLYRAKTVPKKNFIDERSTLPDSSFNIPSSAPFIDIARAGNATVGKHSRPDLQAPEYILRIAPPLERRIMELLNGDRS
ncbi:hypothetical protein KM043_009382 [Ampulex compressa]|nr:hypothetical protein KM043_009382 [Ampulex compressa]